MVTNKDITTFLSLFLTKTTASYVNIFQSIAKSQPLFLLHDDGSRTTSVIVQFSNTNLICCHCSVALIRNNIRCRLFFLDK